jgi:hypothetical protein
LACYFATFHECVSELTDVDLENVLVKCTVGDE